MNTDDFHTNYAEEFGGIITTKPMPSTPAPQSVTSRYTAKLLRDGKNNEFMVLSLEVKTSKTELDHEVGPYYRIRIKAVGAVLVDITTDGATPFQALERALTKAGVTFR